ncbi:glycosyltransferase family 2 protein [Halarchaeum salinum]|uniref:Glycosyltransferase 2-like domain-containing protein n=1 Tax=Halarchaeum salinum TaxID=489912 RepID=A0AAV3S9W7_9EURY
MTAPTTADVTLEKTVVIEGFTHPVVRLAVRSTAEDALVTRLVDRLPADRPLAVTSSETGLVGGRLEATVALAPGGTAAFYYGLGGDADRDALDGDTLPAPEVAHVGAFAGTDLDPALRWRGPDDDWLALALVDPADADIVSDPSAIEGLVVDGFHAERDTTAAPALGVVATGDHADAVYRTILRAHAHGLDVYLTADDTDSETVRLAARLGAIVVAPPDPTDEIPEHARERALAAAARAAGHPGIIHQPPSCPRIDYARTLDAFAANGWEVRAVPEASARAAGGPDVLVAIPAYRAEATIGTVVREARRYADQVLVVVDGSGDDTAERAREAGAAVVEHARNRGYGGALKTIFREAARRGAVHTVTLDADGQHDPADVPSLVAAQRDGHADVVIGNRFMAGATTDMPFVRTIGLGMVNLLTNLSMGRFLPDDWVRDTQSGYRAYTVEAVRTLADARDIGDGMWASTDILYALDRERYTFAEVPTTIRYDLEGTSTEGALEHGLGLFRNLGGILEHTHPMVLVGLPGAMCVLLGSFLGALDVQRFITTGTVSIGLTVAVSAFTVFGVLLLFTAVLIHTINTHPSLRERE